MGSWEYEMGFKDGKKGQDATITSLREEIDGLKAEVAAFERARGELISNTIKENAALKLRDESLEARLEFRGKVTKGVFCYGCASWEQMAWEAEAKLEKVRLIVDDERTGDISAFTAFLRVKEIIGEGEK